MLHYIPHESTFRHEVVRPCSISAYHRGKHPHRPDSIRGCSTLGTLRGGRLLCICSGMEDVGRERMLSTPAYRVTPRRCCAPVAWSTAAYLASEQAHQAQARVLVHLRPSLDFGPRCAPCARALPSSSGATSTNGLHLRSVVSWVRSWCVTSVGNGYRARNSGDTGARGQPRLVSLRPGSPVHALPPVAVGLLPHSALPRGRAPSFLTLDVGLRAWTWRVSLAPRGRSGRASAQAPGNLSFPGCPHAASGLLAVSVVHPTRV